MSQRYKTEIYPDPQAGWGIRIVGNNRILWQSGSRYVDPGHAKSALPALRKALLFAGAEVRVLGGDETSGQA